MSKCKDVCIFPLNQFSYKKANCIDIVALIFEPSNSITQRYEKTNHYKFTWSLSLSFKPKFGHNSITVSTVTVTFNCFKNKMRFQINFHLPEQT